MDVVRKGALSFVAFGVPLLFAVYFAFEWKAAQWLIYLALGSLLINTGLNYLYQGHVHRSHAAFLGYFSVLALATTFVSLESAHSSALPMKTLFAAFVLMSVFVSVHYLLRNRSDVVTVVRGLCFAGYAIALSVYVSAALYLVGIEFGEVQVFVEGEMRSFGPLGDQVGFILLLFLIRGFLRRDWLSFGFHLGAILLTATRGAFVALGITILALAMWRARGAGQPSRYRAVAIFATVVVVALVASQFGGFLLDRFINIEILSQGVSSRLGSMMLGWVVFSAHPLFGVGFSRFQEVVWGYGPENQFDVMLENFVATTANQLIQTAADGGVVAVAAFVILLLVVLRESRQSFEAEGEMINVELRVLWIWIFAIAIGNQSAVWILPDSLLGYLWFLAAGIGCRCAIMRRERAMLFPRAWETSVIWKPAAAQ